MSRYKHSGLFDTKHIELCEGDRVVTGLPTGHKVKGYVRFIDGCFEIVFDEPWDDLGQIRSRDYLKCYTCNHAVTIIHEDKPRAAAQEKEPNDG